LPSDLPKATGAKRLHVTGLFAGIGGLELGLRKAGHETDLLCEIDPGASAVLRARFPELALHDDVCTLASLPASTNLVVAGFPCQDLSQAGKTVGIEGSRSGLVGEVFRLLRKRSVPWVLLENVPFMLQLSRGRAMEVIVSAMEDLGYRWAYRVVNSRAFGVPQRRERVLFLASLEHDPRDVLFADDAGEPAEVLDPLGKVACGFYWTEGIRGLGWAVDGVPTLKGGSSVGIPSPPAIVLPDGRVVTPDVRDAERMQGFEPDWTAPSSTVARKGHRWKLVGNAVTVDVAQWLGRRLTTPSQRGRQIEGSPLDRSGAWPKAAWNVGDGRFVARISTFPAHVPHAPLHEWLRFEPMPLSAKAAAGFLDRTEHSSLRFPPGFLDLIEAHRRAMEREPAKRSGLAVANG
jgi:DNA (cytosine-5)-methyltransferase 1